MTHIRHRRTTKKKNIISKKLKKTYRKYKKNSILTKNQKGLGYDNIDTDINKDSLFGIEIEIGVDKSLKEDLDNIIIRFDEKSQKIDTSKFNSENNIQLGTEVTSDATCEVSQFYENVEYASATFDLDKYKKFREIFLSKLFENQNKIEQAQICGIHVHWSNIKKMKTILESFPSESPDLIYKLIAYNAHRMTYIFLKKFLNPYFSGRIYLYDNTTPKNFIPEDINSFKKINVEELCGDKKLLKCYDIKKSHFEFRIFSLDCAFHKYHLKYDNETFKNNVLKEIDKFIIITDKFLCYILDNISYYFTEQETFKTKFLYDVKKSDDPKIKAKFDEIFGTPDELFKPNFEHKSKALIYEYNVRVSQMQTSNIIKFNNIISRFIGKKIENTSADAMENKYFADESIKYLYDIPIIVYKYELMNHQFNQFVKEESYNLHDGVYNNLIDSRFIFLDDLEKQNMRLIDYDDILNKINIIKENNKIEFEKIIKSTNVTVKGNNITNYYFVYKNNTSPDTSGYYQYVLSGIMNDMVNIVDKTMQFQLTPIKIGLHLLNNDIRNVIFFDGSFIRTHIDNIRAYHFYKSKDASLDDVIWCHILKYTANMYDNDIYKIENYKYPANIKIVLETEITIKMLNDFIHLNYTMHTSHGININMLINKINNAIKQNIMEEIKRKI